MNKNEIDEYVKWATTKEFRPNITTFKVGDKKPKSKRSASIQFGYRRLYQDMEKF